MEISDIIQRINYFRNKSNLSARELSLRIGKHEGYINKLESKDFNLPTNMLLQIISALEITEEEFFAQDYMNFKANKDLNTLINNLPKDKKQSLIEFISK